MNEAAPAPRWTDSHCHLPDRLAEAAVVADAARAAGVERLIDIGTTVGASQVAIERASALSGVWATAGVHPHDANDGLDGLTDLLAAPQVVAVGECGLDYHYDHSPRDVQRRVWADQIGLAHDHGLPLVIHSRDAWDDTFAVLDAEGMPPRTVFHCFTGGPAEAEAALERGALLSFSGIVTFANADELRGAARLCPLDRLLVETDSPYLAPAPHRGQPNQPANVPLVGAGVAGAKQCPIDDVAAASWANAAAFYGLDAE